MRNHRQGIIWGCIGIAGLGAVSLLVWLKIPKLRESELHDEVLQAAEERHRNFQKIASQPKRNAFFSRTFQPLWEIKENPDEEAPVVATIRRWLENFPVDLAEPIQEYSQRVSDLKYSRCKADFSRLALELQQELQEKLIVAPGDLATRAGATIDSVHLALLAEGLYRLAEAQSIESHFGDASRTLITSIRMAASVQKGGGCSEKIFGKSLQRRNTAAITSLIPTAALASEDWELLSSALLAEVPPENELIVWLEDSIVATRADLWPKETPDNTGSNKLNFLHKLFEAREELLFSNAMKELLLSARAGESLKTPSVGLFPSQSLLDSMMHLTYLNRIELQGLGIATSLLAHKSKHNRFPERLESLELGLVFTGWNWDPDDGVLFVPLDSRFIVEDTATESWRAVDEKGWTFTLQ